METAKGILVAIVAFVMMAILGIAAWQFGWFVTEKNVDRQVNIDNRNKGTQTAWRDQAVQNIKDYELVDPANTAARSALRDQTCELIARLTPPYRDTIIVRFETKECS